MNHVEAFLHRLVRWSYDNSKSVLTITVVMVMGLGFFASRIPEAISIGDQLDPARDESTRLVAYREDFRDHGILGFLVDTSYVGVESLCRFEDRLSKYVLDIPEIRSHLSPLLLTKVSHDGERFAMESVEDQCHFQAPPAKLRFDSFTTPATRDFFLGKNGTSWLYLFQLQDPLTASRVTNWLPDLEKNVESFLPGATFDWFGSPVQELHMHIGAKKIQIVNLVIVLAVIVGFRFFFGTWKSGIIFWLTMIGTFSVVYGGFSLSGGKQDLVFLTLFMTMTVAALEDFIFVALALPGEQATLAHFESNALPSFLTSVTTFIGFVSLVTSDLQSIRLFGVWAGIGAMTEWLVVFTVLPAVVRQWPSWGRWVKNESFARGAPTKALLSFKLSPILGLLCFAVFLLPFADYDRFQVTQSPAKTFPEDHEVTKAYDLLTKSRGWIGNVDLVFKRDLPRERKKEIVATLAREPDVVHIDDSASLVETMSNSIQRTDLKDAVANIFLSTPAGKRYFAKSGDERAWMFLDTLDIKKILALEEKTKALCPDGSCALQGDFLAFAQYSKNLLYTLFSSFLGSITLVGFLLAACAMSVGKTRLLPAILLSSFWAPFAVMFTIWVFDIEVNFVTSVVLSVLVGLTGDNAIHYIYADTELDKGAAEKGRATLVCSLSMIGVSLLFVLAPFQPTKLLGLLLAQGFMLVFVGDYALLRGLLESKFLRARRPREEA